MSIAIHQPWGLFDRLNRELGFIDAAATQANFLPAVDVREEADRFIVEADLPGVAPTDIEVTAEKGVLTLRGERKPEQREAAKGYERIERRTGKFERRFALPDNAQAEAIKARFTHGVLEVSIPKQTVTATRVQVEVH
jgi:HSP20 family protein